MQTNLLRIDNDVTIHYQKKGDGDPIIFIHGFSLDLTYWEKQVEYFSNEYLTLTYDLRGFGQSSKPQSHSEYSHSTDLLKLIGIKRIDKAHIVGLSLGGRVALDFATKYPDKLLSLTIADSVPYGFPRKQGRVSVSSELKRIAKTYGVSQAIKTWLEHPIFSHAVSSTEAKYRLINIVSQYNGWHWLNDDNAIYEDVDLNLLDASRIPVMCVIGEYDLSDYHVAAQMIHSAIGGSELHIIKNVGHLSNLENSIAFNDLLNRFIKTRSKK